MFKKIVKIFDHLEDRVRGKLSHYPITYAIIAGVSIVLFGAVFGILPTCSRL